MKFTEEKLEKAFAGLLVQEGFPRHLGIGISHISASCKMSSFFVNKLDKIFIFMSQQTR